MKMRWDYLLGGALLSAIMMLSGCAMTPPRVSLSDAIGSVQKDLLKSQTSPISSFYMWSDRQKLMFGSAIRSAQCEQYTENPIIPIISGQVALNMTGSFTQSGSFEISSITTAPSVGLSGTAGKTVGQGINVPISFVSLVDTPQVVQEIEVTRAGSLLAQNDDNRHAAATDITDHRKAFEAFVRTIRDQFTPLQCTEQLTHGPQFVGLKVRK